MNDLLNGTWSVTLPKIAWLLFGIGLFLILKER